MTETRVHQAEDKTKTFRGWVRFKINTGNGKSIPSRFFQLKHNSTV